MTEALSEQAVELITADGRMEARVVRPAASGPHPVVILCVEACGQGPGAGSGARSLASTGYYVMERVLKQVCAANGAASDPDGALGAPRVARDTEAMVRHLDGDPAAMATEIGVIGFGLGGAYVIGAAAQEPARVKAVAAINGRGLVTDHEDSPHRLVRLVAGEMYFGFSRHDDSPEASELERLATALVDCSAPHRLDRRLDVPPGVAAQNMADPGHEDAHATHQRVLLPLLRRRLPQPDGLISPGRGADLRPPVQPLPGPQTCMST